MGMFERLAFIDGRWVTVAHGEPVSAPLVVDIHDSSIATVQFESEAGPRGYFYLGYEPRIYFDDPKQNAPVDRPAAAGAFSSWARAELGVEVASAAVESLLASNDAEAEPEAVFVEETVEELITLLGLPLPEALQAEA
ncbi:hypothetical protein OEB99_06245 [Actinotalea sp. M2MS4P-6]|uniref:hypothetical protein n=1 Tax=Actinotalea sp. M2MS4P-6 TaxID=2983762 RepID=UPI0021E35B8F|nr:hypothetical protein [Actinotalea sp. M2MS4P-6]MCV2393902.1 hypothetical protein [Actinotalea sp. M2MS4P-6]